MCRLEGDDAVRAAPLALSHGDDDFADLDVRFHVTVGIDDLSEREGLADDWFEVPFGEIFIDVLLCL